jgi:ankyrin repeat protein
MTSRRRHRSSSREYRPPEGGEAPAAPGRGRRTRLSSRLKRKLMALAFGCALFAVSGGLLVLLVAESGDGDDGEASTTAPISRGYAPQSALAAGPVPVVTCPGSAKSAQHPAYAAACGDSAALKGLLARPGARDAPDPRPEFAGRTALHHAAQRGDTTMLAALLAAGADPNQPDAAGHTPLHLVAATPQLRQPEFVARRLLDGGARLDVHNGRGFTPIQELEADHQRLLAQQNLAMVLHQAERENQLAQWLTPSVPGGERPLLLPSPEPPQETVVEVDTALGRVRIPVDAPSAGSSQ